MKVQKEVNPAMTGTDNDPSAKEINTTTEQSIEAADNDGMLNTGGDTPPINKVDSYGDETENNDTDVDDEATETETDTEVEADVEIDSDVNTALTWDFSITSDSTALNVINDIIIEDDGDFLGVSNSFADVEAFLSGETQFASDEKKLLAGQELIREFFAQQNLAMSGVVGSFTGYTVQTGRLLIALKPLVKAIGVKWEPWAADNLKFMAPRIRQACMQLAKVSDINNHLHFGKERLLLLAGAVKGVDGDDPIGDLLRKYNLEFDPTEEIDLDAYKNAVDLVLDFERLKKAGLDVDIESLKKFRADGRTVNASLIKVLKAIKGNDGNPNKYLTNPRPKDGSEDGEKKAKSFKKMATTLAGTIDWISEHEEFIEQVDVAMIDELTTKLEALKRLIDTSDETEAQD